MSKRKSDIKQSDVQATEPPPTKKRKKLENETENNDWVFKFLQTKSRF